MYRRTVEHLSNSYYTYRSEQKYVKYSWDKKGSYPLKNIWPILTKYTLLLKIPT